MGDPKKSRKLYTAPIEPFDTARTLEELSYVGKYGLKNKTEFWRHRSQLRNYRKMVRWLKTVSEIRRKLVFSEITTKLYKLGIIPSKDSTFDEVLGTTVDSFLDRRLQTVVFKKGMAKTIYEARQLITHGHIIVNGQRMNSPSYLVHRDEEPKLGWYYKSPFLNRAPQTPSVPKKKLESPQEDFRGRGGRGGGFRQGPGRSESRPGMKGRPGSPTPAPAANKGAPK